MHTCAKNISKIVVEFSLKQSYYVSSVLSLIGGSMATVHNFIKDAVITKHALERYEERIYTNKREKKDTLTLVQESLASAEFYANNEDRQIWETWTPYPCRLVIKPENKHHQKILLTVMHHSNSHLNIDEGFVKNAERMQSINTLLQDLRHKKNTRGKHNYIWLADLLFTELAILKLENSLLKKKKEELDALNDINNYKNNVELLLKLLKSGKTKEECINDLETILYLS